MQSRLDDKYDKLHAEFGEPRELAIRFLADNGSQHEFEISAGGEVTQHEESKLERMLRQLMDSRMTVAPVSVHSNSCEGERSPEAAVSDYRWFSKAQDPRPPSFLQVTKTLRSNAKAVIGQAKPLRAFIQGQGRVCIKCFDVRAASELMSAVADFASKHPSVCAHSENAAKVSGQELWLPVGLLLPAAILELIDDIARSPLPELRIDGALPPLMKDFLGTFQNQQIVKVAALDSSAGVTDEPWAQVDTIHRDLIGLCSILNERIVSEQSVIVSLQGNAADIHVISETGVVDLSTAHLREIVSLAVLWDKDEDGFHVDEFARIYGGNATGTPRKEFSNASTALREKFPTLKFKPLGGGIKRMSGLRFRRDVSVDDLKKFLERYHKK